MEIIILVHVGIAVWLYRYFSREDRGSKEPKGALQTAAAFGVVAVFIAGFVNDFTLPKELVVTTTGVGLSTGKLLKACLIIGINEEMLKFLPLAIFIYKKNYFNELTDGVIYFGLCGMWFGAIESITYGLQYGGQVGLLRAIIMPFLHAGFAAIAGVGLARYKILTKQFTTVIIWLLAAILLHGIYDYFIFDGQVKFRILSLVMAIGINLGLFIVFKKSRKWDEQMGLSAVGINNFCRNCGIKNHEKNLYCTSCGKLT